MNRHLNLFEYFSQSNVLPIENNSTRNLAIVLMNNNLAFDRFIDLINTKSKSYPLSKPRSPDDISLNIQSSIKDLADQIVAEKIIGITLTTDQQEIIGIEGEKDGNITDIAICCCGTLLIIEAKRDNSSAMKQVMLQVEEFVKFSNSVTQTSTTVLNPISLKWEDVVHELDAVNELLDGREVILNDYISHIRNRVPKFFPIRTISKINSSESALVRKRLERFAENYHGSKDEVIFRGRDEEEKYWVKLKEYEFVKEFCYQYQNGLFSLHLYPGNTVGQGRSFYSPDNKLSILNQKVIESNSDKFSMHSEAEFKVSDSWGKWKFNVAVKTSESRILRELFNHLCGKKTSEDIPEIESEFGKHSEILDFSEFSRKYYDSFKIFGHKYTFFISLTVHVQIDIPFEKMKKVDTKEPNSTDDDNFVGLTRGIINSFYDLVMK